MLRINEILDYSLRSPCGPPFGRSTRYALLSGFRRNDGSPINQSFPMYSGTRFSFAAKKNGGQGHRLIMRSSVSLQLLCFSNVSVAQTHIFLVQ
jgi:hypothetical protein